MVTRLSLFLSAAALAVAGALASFGATSEGSAPSVANDFALETIAHVPAARELAAAPNGDLLVGTYGSDVYIVPHAEGSVGQTHVFVHMHDQPAAGVALDGSVLFVGTPFGVWRVTYAPGDQKARSTPAQIARLRISGVARDHETTTVAVTGRYLYASVGSSCDACDPEVDATRATVQQMTTDGKDVHAKAVHIRNAIALAVNAATGSVWAGVADQDQLPHGHPYEAFDPITAHEGTVDYGWPHCYDNHHPAEPGVDCSHQTPARVVFPAYDTPIGAAFYSAKQKGRWSFGPRYGGAFVALHGSWHTPPVPPRVVFVALSGDRPKTPVAWNDPSVQWQQFVGGFQLESGERIGRPTGVAVGPEGSLFVADDKAGAIYRIRPRR